MMFAALSLGTVLANLWHGSMERACFTILGEFQAILCVAFTMWYWSMISIIVPARNDSYGGDFLWRLSACLNCNIINSWPCGDCEFIVVDWGSDIPLHEVVTLDEITSMFVKFIHVPKDVTGDTFSQMAALNVGLRHAKGDVLVAMDADMILTPQAYRVLNDFRGKVGVAARRTFPMAQSLLKPNPHNLWKQIKGCFAQLPIDRLGHGYATPSGCVVGSREAWDELGGYDESQRGTWGWLDTDLTLRASQRWTLQDLTIDGFGSVHLEHMVSRDYSKGTPLPRATIDDDPQFHPNGDNWGMADQEFSMAYAQPRSDWPFEPNHNKVAPCVLTPEGVIDRMSPMRTYCEVGLVNSWFAAHAAKCSPGVSLYLIPNWSKPLPGMKLEESFAYGCDRGLKDADHQGSTRIITGTPIVAVGDLLNSEPDLQFDMIVIHKTYAEKETAAEDFLKHRLSERGAIVRVP